MGGSAANTHRADRCLNFHVTCLSNCACYKGERPPFKIDQRRICFALGIINELIHLHRSIARDVERSSIGKDEGQASGCPGFNEVAPINYVADLDRIMVARWGISLDDHGPFVFNGHWSADAQDLSNRL